MGRFRVLRNESAEVLIMNSRERIRAALRRKPVDRVAIDFGGTGTTGVNIYSYMAAKKLLGLPETTLRLPEVLSQLVEVEPEMLELLGGDVVCLWRQTPCLGMRHDGYKLDTLLDGTQAYIPKNFNPVLNADGSRSYRKPLDDLTHPYPTAIGKGYDEGVEVSRCPVGLKAFARVYHPMRDVMSLEEFEEWSFPVMDEQELKDIGQRAKTLYETTDKAICGVFNGNVFELGQLYWGYENFFCNMMDEDAQDMMERYFEKRTDLLMKDLENYLAVCGQYIDCIEFTEDLGTQLNLLISPTLYRSMVKPHHKRMFDYIHKNYPEVKILFHSCGAIFDLIGDFIEIGADALNPVQISANGMDPQRLVDAYGDSITFWGGGVDTQSTLVNQSPEAVAAEVKKNLDIFTKAGGYVFTQVHNLEASVSGENLLAAFRTAKAYQL